NLDTGGAREVKIPARTPSATLVDKYGRESALPARAGLYSLTLPPATNNNNFSCQTAFGCNERDYIMGGSPYLIVEPDGTVPAAVINPMPTGLNAPFATSWRSTRAGVAGYDVQYMDVADSTWRDWQTNTRETSAILGQQDQPVQLNHTYAFRVRA